MISAHEVREMREMVEEEEKWFSDIENMLADAAYCEKLEDVRKV